VTNQDKSIKDFLQCNVATTVDARFSSEELFRKFLTKE